MIHNYFIRIGLILCSLFILEACSSKVDLEYDEPIFSKEKALKVTVLNNDILTGNAYSLMLYDTLAIAVAKGVDQSSMQMFALKDGTHIGGFAFCGRGDTELTNYHMYDIEDNGLLVAMDTNGKVVEFNLKKIINGDEQYANKRVAFPKLSGYKMRSIDDVYVFMQGRPRLCVIDKISKDTLLKYNEYPYVTEQINKDAGSLRKYFAYSSKYATNSDASKICTVSRNGMIMEILSIKNNIVTSERVRKFYYPKLKSPTRGTDDCIRGAFAVEATNKYIYLLYHDTPCLDMDNNPKLGIFNWNGDEVACYTFDKKVFRLAVTENDKRAYCWGRDSLSNDFFGYFDLK